MIYKTKPFDHQVTAYNKLFGKEYAALLAEMGTGKTKVAVDIASNLFLNGTLKRVLVIAPKGIHAQWSDEQLPIHSPIPWTGFIWESKNTKTYKNEKTRFLSKKNSLDEGLKWFFVNVDAFSTDTHLRVFRDYLAAEDSMVIVDEATTIKEPKSKRSINISFELGTAQKIDQRLVGFVPASKYRLILTGSLVNNSPFDVYQPFNFLKFDYFGRSFFSFKNRYGIQKKETSTKGRDFWRGLDEKEIRRARNGIKKGFSVEDVAHVLGTSEDNIRFLAENPELKKPYKHLDELKVLMKPVSFIIRKEECLDLPEQTFEKLPVEFSAEQKRIYKTIKESLVAEYEGKLLTVANKLALVGRLQQITAGYFPSRDLIENEEGEQALIQSITRIGGFGHNPKHNAVLRDFQEVTFEHPVLVWGRFTKEIEDFAKLVEEKRQDLRVRTYYGKTTDDERREIKADFVAGGIDVLVLNPAVGGMGLNLQNSHLAYYLTNDYSFDKRAQSEARIHRNGQKWPCTYKDVVIPYTIDERVLEVLRGKRSLSDYFMDKEIKEFIE
jgi:SNF2 family DNA or RNA helicase